ncbi:glycoside hydrolase family 76 protein [Chitinophaga horti]|uniref:Glycoside hydrolase family 76 protein n=1 Tax=Chitinophaga horti TaxID=2920382 RepID=A0ABY6J6E0_9BACT|nr:glycoside hydrolase family 76 protein [Chitinophaga horti]UYQ94162.1 glycoside hydrolase family 76 protein [Chitinophaga horti]
MRRMILSTLLSCTLLSASAQQLQPAAEYQRRAEEMFHRVWTLYRVPQHGLFSEYYPQQHKDSLTYMQDGNVQSKAVSYLWPLSGVVTASNMLIRLPGKKAAYQPYADTAMAAMYAYRDTTRNPTGYQAYPAKFEKVDRYYDDNGLVAIDYAEAYLNTRNPVYLSRAKEVFAFILSGWTDVLGGGVTWLEGHGDQKPACSNGMATLAALKIYKASGDKYYLQQGIRFYDWMHKHLRDSAGLYVNDIKTATGKVNPVYYTYNTGAMLEAAMMLHSITHEKKYLTHARQSAEAAYQYFGQPQQGMRSAFCDLPWFATVLFRGYEALYEVTKDKKYLAAIIDRVDHAWTNRDPNGLTNHDWSEPRDNTGKPKWLLDEACIAEIYARMALLDLK